MTIVPAISKEMIALYDRFTHGEGMTGRREMLAGLARLTGSVALAAAVLPSIEARAEAAPLTSADDPRLQAEMLAYAGANGHRMTGYLARPKHGAERLPTTLVIHENRGLNEHIRDVTRRLALSGMVVLAPDFLAPLGETPRRGDGVNSADDIARLLVGSLDPGATVADAVASLDWLKGFEQGRGTPSAVGYCWGGGVVNRLAMAAGAKLRAGVVYYGPAPADTAGVGRIRARMLLHYAGLDERVNAGAPAWLDALKVAGVTSESYIYPNVNHAFNNDTAPARYDKAAAHLAWDRTLAWLKA